MTEERGFVLQVSDGMEKEFNKTFLFSTLKSPDNTIDRMRSTLIQV